MKTQNYIGFAVKGVDHLLHRRINQIARERGLDDITIMHSFIIHFLHENQGRDIFQRDLERNFHVTRSTITNLVQFLEKNGYITREPVPIDARLKKIVLTSRGEELDNQMKYSINEAEKYVDSALSTTEKEQFLLYCQKIRQKLEEYPNKEEIL